MQNKVHVSFTINPEVLKRVDNIRGYAPRSTMVNVILEDVLGIADEQHAGNEGN